MAWPCGKALRSLPAALNGPSCCCLTLLLMRFASRFCCQNRGGLLPHPFTLTQHLLFYTTFLSVEIQKSRCWAVYFLLRCLSQHLNSYVLGPGITRHHALRSPDFPPDHIISDYVVRRQPGSSKNLILRRLYLPSRPFLRILHLLRLPYRPNPKGCRSPRN